MSAVSVLLEKIRQDAERVEFQEVIDLIDQEYTHQPSAFINGDVKNSAEQNQGSCKILAFAQRHQLTEFQTLACFGHYYRKDVLENPTGTSHGNIRAFIKSGWAGVSIPENALQLRN